MLTPVCSLADGAQLQLRFNLQMVNPGAHELGPQRLWMYLPVGKNDWWTLEAVETEAAHALQTDSLGHTILFVETREFSGFARRSAALAVRLKRDLARLPARIDADEWLRAERFIESEDKMIAAHALALRAATDQATVRNIYEFVVSHLVYAGYVPEDLGALYALKQRRGDCSEYASLVVALCRALGIPARRVGGYVTDRSFAPKPMDFHDWAEVAMDGRWRVVDAQKGALADREIQYVPFRYYRDAVLNNIGTSHRYRVEGNMEFSV
ncbi:transglutaminase-like domain-containing protein [Variovorax paradoxus]|uniref:transglutaminase-like domain-containing protein n=1 Tax=Variovorax paradoxus TaxID=34073 RepID=UPI003D64665D